MASIGQNFNQTVILAETPDAVSQALIASTTGVPDYVTTTAGSGSILLSRKYTPTWAIVVAVIGLLFFLIGLLALLYKVTETLSITLTPYEGGTKVIVSGVGSQDMLARITATMSAMPALAPGTHPAVPRSGLVGTPGPAMETKTCPACAESVKAAAQRCRYCGFQFAPDADPPLPSATPGGAPMANR